MDIDKPLDEIIASKPKGGRRGGGRGGKPRTAGPRTGGAAPAAGAANARARYGGNAAPKAAALPAARPGADATKIIISNLPTDVTEAQVRDLMQSTVGPVKNVVMNYSSAGKSTGTATIVFRQKGDANKAHGAYHNRMIDNQKAMRVEIAVNPAELVSLASRVAPAPQQARGAAQPRRGGRGGAKPREPRAARPKKTAEDLDAEMAAYGKDASTA